MMFSFCRCKTEIPLPMSSRAKTLSPVSKIHFYYLCACLCSWWLMTLWATLKGLKIFIFLFPNMSILSGETEHPLISGS